MVMVRILVTGMIVTGGILAIVLPASAEDGGQYRRGGSSITPEQGMDFVQR